MATFLGASDRRTAGLHGRAFHAGRTATPIDLLPGGGAGHYRWLPVRILLSERYNSQKALSQYAGPVAFLVAGNDEIVPAELGRKLHSDYRGPKLLREQARAGHNTLNFDPSASWWREVADFLLAGD